MKHRSLLTATAVALTLTAALLPGCANDQKKKQAARPAEAPPDTATEPAPEPTPEATARQQAQRLAEALAQRDAAIVGGAPEVQWLEPNSAVPPSIARATPPPPEVEPTPEPVVVQAPPIREPVEVVDAQKLSRAELLDRLIASIAASEDSALAKALSGAAASLASPAAEMAPRLLEGLSLAERDLVARFHQVVLLMQRELVQGDPELARASIERRLEELFGQQPVAIRTLELCQRVSGYGIYEPFESHTFVAGRDQKAIVYVELDNFRPVEQGDGTYKVELKQEVVLYNATDGLAVWKHEPVQIVDESRNRRRDFFVVQLVTLPGRLSVGKYRLKVRVTDLQGGSIDETTMPLEFVADQSLVQGE